jgi:hypothetical protein
MTDTPNYSIKEYNKFIASVDHLCWRIFGCSYYDLPDYVAIVDYFEAGNRPSDVINALAAELSDDRYL